MLCCLTSQKSYTPGAAAKNKFSGFPVAREAMSFVSYFRIYMPKVMKSFTRKYLYADVNMFSLGCLDFFNDIEFKDPPGTVAEDLPQIGSRSRNLLSILTRIYLIWQLMVMLCFACQIQLFA